MFYSQANTLKMKEVIHALYNYLIKREEEREIFYHALENYFGMENVLDFNLARNAFEYIAVSCNIKKILMPAFLCPVFDDVLVRRKIKPVFVDIDVETLNIDAAKAQEAMDRSIDAILCVHTFGNVCELSTLIDLKNDYNAVLIEDCAHAFGARYKNKLAGIFGDFSIFSMYKYFPTIAGGFLLSKTPISGKKHEKKEFSFSLSRVLRLMYMLSILHPFIFRAKEFFKSSRVVQSSASTRKEAIKRCSDFDIVIFNNFFKSIEEEVNARNRVARAFDRKIDSENVIKQGITKESVSSRQSYAMLINYPEKRDEIIKNLGNKGIMAEKTWHDTIILSPGIREIFKINPQDYPFATSASQRIITLPIKAYYKEGDIEFIASNVNKELSRL